MPTIIEMVNHTRLDCVIGGRAPATRRGVAQAIHHAAHRSAFGKLLIDQPLMRNVLADLASSRRRRRSRAMRLARAYDEAHAGDEQAPGVPPPRQRGAQVLDLQAGAVARGRGARVPGRQRLRRGVGACRASTARARSPRSGRARATSSASTCCARWPGTRPRVEAFFAEVGEGAGAEPRLDAFGRQLRDDLASDLETIETRARRVVERMALALQGSLLVRYGDPAVADAFCASRLAGDSGRAFGTPPAGHGLRPHHRAPRAVGCLRARAVQASARPGGAPPPRSAGRRRRACRSRRSRARRWASGSWPAA